MKTAEQKRQAGPARPRRVTFSVVIVSLLLCGVSLRTVAAQSTDTPAQTPLASKQQIIQDRVLRLEDQMYRLIDQLKQQEPEQARRLEKALARMGELGIRQRFEQIISILDQDRLEVAVIQQAELLEQLSTLLTLLLEDSVDTARQEEEIKRLEQLAKELDQLIAQERKLKDASESAEADMQGFVPDAEAAAAIAGLLQDQQALLSDTQDKYFKKENAPTQKELTARQKLLSKSAEELAKLLTDKQESAAAKPMRAAKLNMADAEEELSGEAFGAASDAQEDAIEDLKRALAKLSKRPPPNAHPPDFQELARAQADTSDKTGDLLNDMKENRPDASEPTPGQDNVETGKAQMDAATQDLEQRNPAAAKANQEKAINQLEQAKSKIQQQIDQLKAELQRQKLADLEKKLEAMLAQQQAVNRKTLELHGIPQEQWRRREQLQAREQSQNQRLLGESAQVCLEILLEDGTTTVLPQLLEHLRDDMFAVSGRLADSRVGLITQAAQEEIVVTLEEILDTIEQSRQQTNTSQSAQQSPPASGDPPLLPTSAELKLLADLQQRVFRQTKAHDRVDQEDVESLKRITKRQTDIARMAAKLSNKLTRSRPRPQGPPTEGTQPEDTHE